MPLGAASFERKLPPAPPLRKDRPLKVEVLSDVVNHVVIQCEGRRFPSLAVQGDRLKEWARLLQVGDPESLAILADALERSVEEYERVCRASGIPAP